MVAKAPDGFDGSDEPRAPRVHVSRTTDDAHLCRITR
jgi:hypothetical protein